MKRIIAVSLLVFITLLLVWVTALAQSENDGILIYPWLVPCNGGCVVEVSTEKEVLLGARWGVCKEGMIRAFHSAVHLDWYLEGTPIFASDSAVAQYWSPPVIYDDPRFEPSEQCITRSDTEWWTFWVYSLGNLDPGDYEVRLHYWLDHPVIDGVDSDGSGTLNRFVGTLQDVTITIRVVE